MQHQIIKTLNAKGFKFAEIVNDKKKQQFKHYAVVLDNIQKNCCAILE